MVTKTDLKEIGKLILTSEARINQKLDKLEKKMDYANDFLDRD